jgi:hypothetical protein
MAAGRLMIRTSYRLSASIGGLWLVAGSVVLILLTPASGLFWAGSGAFILGIGMGFCNTAFIVSTQASVGWSDRGMLPRRQYSCASLALGLRRHAP